MIIAAARSKSGSGKNDLDARFDIRGFCDLAFWVIRRATIPPQASLQCRNSPLMVVPSTKLCVDRIFAVLTGKGS